MKHFRLVIAIALVWAIAFSSVAHSKPKRLKPPQIKTTLVRATPIAGYAQSGLEVAISRGWIAQYSPFADRLRTAIRELQSGDIEQAALRSGVKPQVLNRLINVGMVPTAPTAATPESQKNAEVPDDEDF